MAAPVATAVAEAQPHVVAEAHTGDEDAALTESERRYREALTDSYWEDWNDWVFGSDEMINRHGREALVGAMSMGYRDGRAGPDAQHHDGSVWVDYSTGDARTTHEAFRQLTGAVVEGDLEYLEAASFGLDTMDRSK